MFAHVRRSEQKPQLLASHCQNVRGLCKSYAKGLGLPCLAEFIGLLHDMGKATREFCAYLYAALTDANAVSPHYHALTGAIFAYKRWFLPSEEASTRRL